VPALSYAQDTAAPAAKTAPADDTVIVVTGVRASQQSSIDRKKKAKTATDSIVADDIGQFPDKNIGEAIGRIAGVALGRSDYGEGVDVSLRGNPSDLTNVEIDGLGVQNNTLTDSLALQGAGSNGGRGKEFREFPADLVKSVDVVKGSTAQMTEGGLGGSIIIQSRTGLDFKKPYFSFTYELSRNSLGKKLTPTFNVIASRKFFNGRLGVLLNYEKATIQNDQNAINAGGSSDTAGLTRTVDFDNSPNKTFTFNPATVDTGSAGTATIANTVANAAITQNGGLARPIDVVTLSANAKTKADCYAAFPKLTGSPTAAQAAERSNELITCLNQWNDYTPSNIRYFVRRETEDRQTFDLRFDYKVSNDLSVYFKVTRNDRIVDNNQLTFTPGGFGINPNTNAFNTGGFTYHDTLTPGDTAYTVHRTANPGTGYTAFAGPFICTAFTATSAMQDPANQVLCNGGLVDNSVVNVLNDSTLKVDANHHVIGATFTDASSNIDQIHNTNAYRTIYLSSGATFRHGPWAVDLVMGDSQLEYTRYDKRSNIVYVYGTGLMSVAGGLISVTPASAFNLADPSLYSILRPAGANLPAVSASINGPATPAYTIAQQPLTSASVGLQLSPRIQRSEEQTFKLDTTYNFSDKMPFITDIKAGVNIRHAMQKGWQGGGTTIRAAVGNFNNPAGSGTPGTSGYQPPYQAPIVLPTNNLRGSMRACEATATSTLSCNYGYVANTNLSNNLYGVTTFHQADFQNIIAQVISPQWNRFFDGYADRGSLFNGWPQLDVEKLYALSGAPNMNFDCMIRCKASDGNMYYQPYASLDELNNAGYFMVEFEQELPFGVRLNGNAGTRYVKTTTNANGNITLNSIRCVTSVCAPAPTTPDNTTVTYSITQVTHFSNTTTDWTPSYNYALWFWDDKIVARYYWGKVVARPSVGKLLPTGTCTVDQRLENFADSNGSAADQTCGTIGNPGLRPFQSTNQNWSVEVYPNKDTQFSWSVFKNNVKVGDPITVSVANSKLFAGVDQIDPATGKSIAEDEFKYTTYANAPGAVRRGEEWAVKTAFNFLPWYLRYTGFDGNYATLHSSTAAASVDLNSGTPISPQGESSYFYNANFWYDDGKTNARLAYTNRDQFFSCFAPCSAGTNANNYPAGPLIQNVKLPYNPGAPNFTAKAAYLDFKVTHKFKGGVDGYVAIRNALQETVQSDQGQFTAYADGNPNILTFGYSGSRMLVGVTVRR
jgi:TonB-dependent receptor